MTRMVRAALNQAARLIGTLLAVALAVGLVSGTFMLTDTIGAAFRRASPAPTSPSDIVVRATAGLTDQANGLPEREPLPSSVVALVAGLPGVRALRTAIQGGATVVGPRGTPITADGVAQVDAGWVPGDTLIAGR